MRVGIAGMKKSGPFFTEKARHAAAAARHRRAEIKAENYSEFQVFAARVGNCAYRWEIRRFGGIVVAESQEPLASAAAARAAGSVKLKQLSEQSSQPLSQLDIDVPAL